MTTLLLLLCLHGQIITNVTADTRFTDPNLVIKTADIKQGDAFSKYELAKAIRRVYQLKFYEAVDVETTRVADGVSVKFIVKEYPTLKDIKFFGNRKIKAKDFVDKAQIKIGEIVSDQKLFDWQTKIQDAYKEKGFILAKIAIQPNEPDSSNKIAVIVQIDEGEKVKIRKINIENNLMLSDQQLKRKLVNREKTWYRKGLFKEDKFKEDLDKIVEIYKENGYLDAKIEDYNLGFDEKSTRQEWLIISVNISEGPQYYIGNISFDGDSLISKENLNSSLRIKSGQVYNAKKVNQTMVELYSAYSEEGFIYAQITPIEDIINDTVHIKYTVLENNPARIRLVTIEGNERTADKVIRRQVVSLPGSVFKRSDVIRSQQNIFNLGFFDDVQLDYQRATETGDIDLVYKVKEKSSFGTIGAGITYSVQDNITGYIELAQPNLMGRGQKLEIKLEKGGSKANAQIGFSEPYLFDRPLSAGFDISYLTREYDYYEKQEKSFGIDISRPLPIDYARMYFGLRISDGFVPPTSVKSTYTPSGPYNIYRDTVHKTALAPIITLNRDSRDYIFNPLSGSNLTYSLELSTIDINFHRHIFDGSFYFPMFKKFALRLRSRFGVIEGFRSSDTTPIYERFMPGGTGIDGIRGYPDQSLGVREGGYNIGGKLMTIYSLEYKYRPSPQLAFIAFADAGNTWNTYRDLNISNLKRGAGIGVRLEVPMIGLIGFDFGYGFDRDGGGKWEPHFQIGKTF